MTRMPSILLVEDSEHDVTAFERELKARGLTYPLVVASDGEEALEIMTGKVTTKLERPYIVVLDLNLPALNGLEFMRQVRGDPELSDSIIFVYTTSNYNKDVLEAYKENISGYFLKKNDLSGVSDFIELLDVYCSSAVFPGQTV